MKRFLWLITGLWTLASVSIFAVTIPFHGTGCPTLISIREGEMGSYNEVILDFRTGIHTDSDHVKPWQISPDGHYRYIEDYSSDSAQEELYLVSTDSNHQQLLFSSHNRPDATWSADGQSIFVYEEAYNPAPGTPNRLVRFNVESGELMYEYSNRIQEVSSSPDNRFLYVEYYDPLRQETVMASINTLTGTMTPFDHTYPGRFERWSPDNQWWLRGGRDDFYVINPENGDLHPHLNEAITGHSPLWTEESIWFLRDNADGYDIWQASLRDGTLSKAYDNALLYTLSPDDRWAVIGESDDNYSTMILHDRLSNQRYEDIDIYQTSFSEDGRCLLVTSPPAGNTGGQLKIYDLNTMQAIYVADATPYNLRYDWYTEN